MLSNTFISAIISGCLLSASLTTNAEEPPAQIEEEDQKVYRKFYPDGVVEFSDQPSRGSEELRLEALPTYEFTPAVPATSPTPRPKQQTTPKLNSPYTSLTLSKPARDETIRANSGSIDVKFTLVPRLQHYKGHKIEYLLDGKSIIKTDRPHTLKNVSRGTHSLVIQVIDRNNKVLINSDSVSFHVKRFFKSSTTPSPQPKNEVDFDAEYET